MPALSLIQSLLNRAKRVWRDVLSLLSNGYFWGGVLVLVLLLGSVYVVMDRIVLPNYTRHGVMIQVPSVTDLPYDEAVDLLQQYDLQVERQTQQFNPNVPQDIVVDQSPEGQARVKPGRRIYLTVNAGDAQMVRIPPLEGLSLREARNRVQALGLSIDEELPDSIPSAYRNTVTGHEPASGDSLEIGAGITLYYSTGLGDAYVEIPDVTGLSVKEAREKLLEYRLRDFVIGADDSEEVDELEVVAQSRDPGTRMREGSEIRLTVEPS